MRVVRWDLVLGLDPEGFAEASIECSCNKGFLAISLATFLATGLWVQIKGCLP